LETDVGEGIEKLDKFCCLLPPGSKNVIHDNYKKNHKKYINDLNY